MTRDDYDDDDLEFGHCGNIGCEEGWIADCFDGFCINAEDGCEFCLRRCDWCNPGPASVDTRPEGGDATQIAAPFTSGAVGAAETPISSPHPKGQARSNKSRPVT